MKQVLRIVLALSILVMMSLTASAHDWHHDQPYDNDRSWHHAHHGDYDSERNLPFSWHDRYDSMNEHHHLERIYDREWNHRFPGLHAYRWSNHEGFWQHGHYVTDAIFFYDRDNELVSIGYVADGIFIQLRDDHESYENHDSFFISWFHR